MYDPWELIGRYAFTGAILFGVAMLMLTGRLVYKGFTSSCNYWDFLNKFEEAGKGTKDKWYITLIKIVLWPYGIVSCIHAYMKTENKAMDAVMKTK